MSPHDPTRTTPAPDHPPSDTAPHPDPAPAGTVVDRRDTPPLSGPPAAHPAGAPNVPGYEILQPVGEGGMGVVYKARQPRLNRVVALKMILGGRAREADRLRFFAEAEALAAVRHPNVAQVFESGEYDGFPFLVLEFLGGGSLSDRLRAARPTPAEAAALVARIARGVQAAHEQQIVHRDLKPGNVLFDEHSEPKVTDFGLAKRGAGSDLTRTNAVMGTPGYMAPEQAGGRTKFVGPTADVWALGVILYEALAGHRPFDGETTEDVLVQVLRAEPEPPRKSVPGLSADLERVCLKCLEKEPAHRYPTAKELADDLERFVRGEPVSVRPVGSLERTYRWARRNPTRAAAAALLAFSTVVTAVGATVAVLWQNAVRERGEAVTARDRAEGATAAADRLRGEAERQKVELIRANYFRSVDLGWREYLAGNADRAKQLLADAGPEHHGWEWAYIDRRVNADLYTSASPVRAFEQGFPRPGRFTPDGRHLTTVVGGRAVVRDAATGKVLRVIPAEPAEGLIVSRDGTRVAAVSGADGEQQPAGRGPAASGVRRVRVFDALTGREVWSLASKLWPAAAEPGPDGHSLLVLLRADDPNALHAPVTEEELQKPLPVPDQFALIDTRTGLAAVKFQVRPRPHSCVTWALGGKRVLAVEDYRTVRQWDAGTGTPAAANVPPVNTPFGADPYIVSPDGEWLVASLHDGTASVVRVATGEVVRTHAPAKPPDDLGPSPADQPPVFVSAAFGPDSSRLTLRTYFPAGGSELTTYDVRTGAAVASVRLPGSGSEMVSHCPDGRWVGVADGSNLTLVDTASGRRRFLVAGLGSEWSAVFSPDGKRVAAVGNDGRVKAWEVDRPDAVELPTAEPIERVIGYTPDGTRFVVANWPPLLDEQGKYRLVVTAFDTATGLPGGREEFADADPLRLAFRRDGRTVAAVVRGGKSVAWFPSGGAARTHAVPDGTVGEHDLFWHPDGRGFLTTVGGLRFTDAETGREVWRSEIAVPVVHGTAVTRVKVMSTRGPRLVPLTEQRASALATFSPDGSVIAVRDPSPCDAPHDPAKPAGHRTAYTGTKLLDAATGKVLCDVAPDLLAIRYVFSPDSARVAVLAADQAAVFECRTGRPVIRVRTPGLSVFAAAFSPDGSRFATGGYDGRVTLWDARDGREVCATTEPGPSVEEVCFRPDGAQVAVQSRGGSVVLYAAR